MQIVTNAQRKHTLNLKSTWATLSSWLGGGSTHREDRQRYVFVRRSREGVSPMCPYEIDWGGLCATILINIICVQFVSKITIMHKRARISLRYVPINANVCWVKPTMAR